MAKGVVKKGMGTMVGNSGEYFVVASLLKRGIVAALAPRNTPYFDILATDGARSVNIRVKTKSAPSIVWQWMTKEDGTIYRNISRDSDFVCLVDLKETLDNPNFYIFSTQELNDVILADFKKWVITPGRNGRPHDSTNRHRSFGALPPHKELLAQAKNNWKILGFRID